MSTWNLSKKLKRKEIYVTPVNEIILIEISMKPPFSQPPEVFHKEIAVKNAAKVTGKN